MPFLLMLLVAVLSAVSVPVLLIGGSRIGLWKPVDIDWSYAFKKHGRQNSAPTMQGVGSYSPSYSPLAPAMAMAASLAITPTSIMMDVQGAHAASTGASITVVEFNG